jgi:tetratricopeptide (TPR) repeat protein
LLKAIIGVPMNLQIRRAGFALLAFLLTALATDAQGRISLSSSDEDTFASGSITVHIWGPDHERLKQLVVVKLYSVALGSMIERSVTWDAPQVVMAGLRELGRYTVEVSSKGYETQRQDVNYAKPEDRFVMDVTMKPPAVKGETDTAAALAPTIPSKAQKYLQKGIASLQAGKLEDSRRELGVAYQAAPKNSDICYLLGVAYARSQDFENAETYLQSAIASEPENMPALVALGQLRDLKGDYTGATGTLTRVISAEPNLWIAYWVLADVYLRQGNFEKAHKEAEESVELGEGAANKAEFIEGEALAQLGRREDAVKVFQAFIKDSPGDAAVAPALAFVASLRANSPAESSGALKPQGDLPPLSASAIGLPPFGLLISTWGPKDVDQVKPFVSKEQVCPAETVIEGAGKRVTELVENVNNITATEKVVYEDLNPTGRSYSPENRKYDYMASITDNDSGLPVIDENREDTSGSEKLPQGIAPFGLQDLALIFHPVIRNDFQMSCEGLAKWQGQPTWVVYFRQRPDHPKRIRSYEAGGRLFPVGLKGRAWISADSLQIVRMEADLISPVPEVGLESEEDVIEYGPVGFQSKKTELWLPMTADIYFYFHRKPYRRHHDFTNYQLFSVGSTQRIGVPTIPKQN